MIIGENKSLFETYKIFKLYVWRKEYNTEFIQNSLRDSHFF